MSKSYSNSFHLRNAKKYSNNGDLLSSRVRSVEDTLSLIEPLCQKIGVTRISNITNMDRLYIPNYVSILPGTEDTIWVYGGKGPTNAHAKASALMESIERYCSLSSKSSKNLVQGSYTQLSKHYNKVIHPDEVVEPVKRTYHEEIIIDYLPGFDLLKREEVLVPAELVFSRYSPKPPSVNAFLYSHTNGLASGNVLEEAICHGLCEVIERDAVSMAHLCASSIPFSILERIMNTFTKVPNNKSEFNQVTGCDFIDDSSIFPDVNISQIAKEFNPLKLLTDRFSDAGISLLVKDITQEDIGIPTFVASSIEWITDDYGYFAIGYGTHLDSRVALIRAITELSQTRAGDIQGSRDDLKKIRYRDNDGIYKRKWQFMPATSPSSKKVNNTIMFSEIRSYVLDDIREEIEFILSRLKQSGLKRAIFVDLTDPNIGIPVVRVLVPGLETFEIARLFTSSDIIMGRRAKNHFQTLLRS